MKRVVFTPELIGHAFHDATAFRVLLSWRDGQLRPVISRDLALTYTKTLRSIGLGSVLLKRWLWWFSAAEKSEYHPEIVTKPGNPASLCDRLAIEMDVVGVVHSDTFRPSSDFAAEWVSASRVLY